MEGVLEKQVAEAIARVLGDQNPIGQILSAAFENEVSLPSRQLSSHFFLLHFFGTSHLEATDPP